MQDQHVLVDHAQPEGRDRGAVELAGAHLADHGALVALLTVPEELQIQRAVGPQAHGLPPDLEDLAPRRLGRGDGADREHDRIGVRGARVRDEPESHGQKQRQRQPTSEHVHILRSVRERTPKTGMLAPHG